MRRAIPFITASLYLGTYIGLIAHGLTTYPNEFRKVPVESSPIPADGVVEPEEKHSEPELYEPDELVLVTLDRRDYGNRMRGEETR